jgi:hypothetical protein
MNSEDVGIRNRSFDEYLSREYHTASSANFHGRKGSCHVWFALRHTLFVMTQLKPISGKTDIIAGTSRKMPYRSVEY